MNSEQEEQMVLVVIERACAKLGISVKTEIGEYIYGYGANSTRIIFHYDNEHRKIRTLKTSIWLWIFAVIYYELVSIMGDDGAAFIPLLNAALSFLTLLAAEYQHVATNAERNLAIQSALNEAGFCVYMTDEAFEVFL